MFRKLSQLSTPEKLVLFQAAAWLVWLRLLLAVFPFSRVQRLISPAPRSGNPNIRSSGVSPAQIGCLVAVAAARIPATSCLPRALATRALLGRHGHVAELRIGVYKDGSGRFEAHAWVESEGTIISGGSEATRFKPILKNA